MSKIPTNALRALKGDWSGAGWAAALNLGTDTIKMILVNSSYTYSSAHTFLSDLSNTIGSGQAATYSGTADGIAKFSMPSFTGVSSVTIQGIWLYKDTGTSSTSPLIAFFDGKFTVTAQAGITNGATSAPVDPLKFAIANGSTLTFSSAGSPVLTLTAGPAQGARTMAVNGTWGGTGNISAGDTATAIINGCNLPFVVGSSPITFTPTADSTNGFYNLSANI